ncbi:hypothetical protein EJ110_NYTH25649 [Nymphaea thermarum]|nr:hypothetical protein EJ110_NYTH25649 [Nymphaea thermarum]
MESLIGVAIGLSVAFAVLASVLLLEILSFYSKKPAAIFGRFPFKSKKGQEDGNGGEEFATEAALVGSFGGYSASPSTSFKFLPSTTFLFSIKEETKQEMMESLVEDRSGVAVDDNETIGPSPVHQLAASATAPSVSASASACHTPFITPVSSPTLLTPPMTPLWRESPLRYSTAPSSPELFMDMV